MPAGAIDPNEEAFAFYRLAPALLSGISATDLSSDFLGYQASAPVIIGAYAGDLILAEPGIMPIVWVAAELGLPLVISEECLTPLEEIAAHHRGTLLQLIAGGPLERAFVLTEKAATAGSIGIVVTALAPVHPMPGFHPGGFDIKAEIARRGLKTIGSAGGVGNMPAFPAWGWGDLAKLVEHAHGLGLKVVVKGVLRPADAQAANTAGCDGVMVSNLGVRQLYRWVPAIDQLTAVRDSAGGTPVMIDGGVRNGGDVVVALCLGASFATLVRPVVRALAGGGEPAVRDLLTSLIEETYTIAAWMGAGTPADLHVSQVVRIR